MHKQRAQTVVEFAFVTPILLLLTLGVLCFGRAFYTYVDLANAARAGARFAIANQAICASSSSFTTAVEAIQPNISWPAAVTITPDCAPKDANGNVIPQARRVTITYPFDTLIPQITSLPLVGPVNLFGIVTISVSATLPLV